MSLDNFLKQLNISDEMAFDSEEKLAFEVAEMITDARVYSGLTQEKLAEKLSTSQPSIARLENGNSLPSLKFLLKVAKALNTKIIPPKFEIVQEIEDLKKTIQTFNFPQKNLSKVGAIRIIAPSFSSNKNDINSSFYISK